MQSPTANSILPKVLVIAIIALALIGFADSTFLLAKRISGTHIPCFITTGCDEVAKSPYAVIFGVPLSLLGVIFYLGIGLITLLYADTKNLLFAKLIFPATLIGFLCSCYFLYVQKFLIGSFCIYCIGSAITSTLLFLLGILVYRKLKEPVVSL